MNTSSVPADPGMSSKIAADVRDMRQRIAAEKGTDNIWDLKQVRGGLVDVEFVAQYLQLIHAHAHPDMPCQGLRCATAPDESCIGM